MENKPDTVNPDTPFAYKSDTLVSVYQTNLNHAIRNAFALEDSELIVSLHSAKKCYHIFKSRGDEDTAQFYQLFYHSIKAQISLRWKRS